MSVRPPPPAYKLRRGGGCPTKPRSRQSRRRHSTRHDLARLLLGHPARRAARGPRRPSGGSAPRSWSCGSQPSCSLGLRCVADQVVHLGRAHEALVDAHVLIEGRARRGRRRSPPARGQCGPRRSRSRSRRARPAGASATSPRRSPCAYPQSRSASRLPSAQLVLQAELDRRRRVRDLARHELEPAARALVVEEDPRASRSRS